MPETDPTEEVQKLFVANISTVKHYAISLLPNPSEAEDIVQEVFITVTTARKMELKKQFPINWIFMLEWFRI